MRKSRFALIAGFVGIAAAGTAMAAAAEMHTMQVALPDGGVAQISYSGNVAPRVVVAPADMRQMTLAEPAEASLFAPFAEMERISALMEQRHQMMLQRIAAMQRQAEAMAASSLHMPQGMVMTGDMPAGTVVHYSFYSSTTGNGGCTQSVEWRSDGSGQQPQMIRTSSGDCDGVDRAAPSSVIATSATPEQTSEPEGNKA